MICICPDKCKLDCLEIKYLRLKGKERGLQVDDDKIKPIFEFPKLKNIIQVQRLIEKASYNPTYVLKFAEIIESLNRLHKRENKWERGKYLDNAFDKIKGLLTSAPILTCPHFT